MEATKVDKVPLKKTTWKQESKKKVYFSTGSKIEVTKFNTTYNNKVSTKPNRKQIN